MLLFRQQHNNNSLRFTYPAIRVTEIYRNCSNSSRFANGMMQIVRESSKARKIQMQINQIDSSSIRFEPKLNSIITDLLIIFSGKDTTFVLSNNSN